MEQQNAVPILAGINKEIYLKQLCATTGYPFDKLPIQDFEPLQTHAEINKFFFSLESAPDAVSINGSQAKALEQMEMRSADTLEDLAATVQERRTSWERAVSAVNERQMNLIEAIRTYEEAKVRPRVPLLDVVKEIHAEGRWKLLRASKVEGFVEFVQLHDTILSWRDRDKAVDVQVNLGRFTARVHLNGHVSIHPHSGNIEANGYNHPHTKKNGWVCWGNAQQEVRNAFVANDLKKVLAIVQLFLTEYNDASPYVSIMTLLAKSGVPAERPLVFFDASHAPEGSIPIGLHTLECDGYERTLVSMRTVDGRAIDERRVMDATGREFFLDGGVERFDSYNEAHEAFVEEIREDDDEADYDEEDTNED